MNQVPGSGSSGSLKNVFSGPMLCKMADYTVQHSTVSRNILIEICQVLLEYYGHDTSVEPYVRCNSGFGPPADLVPPGPNPIADLVPPDQIC